jgi:hypothetical protein
MIIGVMAARGHGVVVLSALSGTLVTFACCAFVDDTDLVHSAKTAANLGEDAIGEMQGVLDRGGRSASCRRLVGSFEESLACHRFHLDWLLVGLPEQDGHARRDILITDVDERHVVLTWHDPDVGLETLGVMQAMDRNNREEVKHFRKEADNFADSMRTDCLSKKNACHALTERIMKTMEHPMTAITLTKSNWEHIMVPILKAGLPCSGIDRLFPQDVLHGPSAASKALACFIHGVTRKSLTQWHAAFSRQRLGMSLDN